MLRPSVVCDSVTLCIAAKRCVLQQKYNTIQYNIRLLALDRTQANNTGTRYARLIDIFIQHKCKKHSLSHQLTAQLHIENSKNKKMVITLLQHIA